mmetsp:Transcript_89272/g.236043  ORF Transcript_89272/g.236043 Transcript_89272/m.236043 type:complete len:569 (-) Transcript_89272:606-2312(-)
MGCGASAQEKPNQKKPDEVATPPPTPAAAEKSEAATPTPVAAEKSEEKNVVEAVGGSEPAAEEPKPAEAAPAEPAVAPVEQEVVKCSMRGRRKPPQQKAGRRPQAKRMVNFGDHDAGKWVLTSTEYDGSYGIIGGTPVVQEKTGPIQEGLDLLKQEPHKYLSLWYQTDMMSWPTEQQQYSLCERRKQRIVVKETQGGPFTYVESKYHALPDCEVQPDQFTDSMAYAGAPCTQGKQPGRGQGCADVPGLSVIKDVDPNDVLQGSVGDCWLLSAMSALAEFSGAVKKVFNKTPGIESLPGPGENKYVVTLYDLKTWKPVDIEIDERLPGNPNGSGLLGCSPSASGDLWAPYIEKACAIHCGGWDKINGGQCTHAWRMLTGCKEQYTFMPDASGMYGCFGAMNPNTNEWEELANSPHDGFRGLWPNPWPAVGGGGGLQHKVDRDEMFERMCAFDDENFIMGAGTKSGSDTQDTDGIVDGHAYTIIDCVNNAGGTEFDLIKVRNPWGSGEFKSGMWDDDGPGWTQYPQVKEALNPVAADDGVFWVDKEEFFKYFKTIYVCAKNMTEFIEAPQ